MIDLDLGNINKKQKKDKHQRTQLANIIEDNTRSLINIAELRNCILDEIAILIHNYFQIANIRMNKKGGVYIDT